jgi:hypothetical protein
LRFRPKGFDFEGKCADYILPSVWTLIMRAIKCLKGVRCDKPWGAAKKL